MAKRSALFLPLILSLPLMAAQPSNPQADYPGFQRQVKEVGELLPTRRITEAEFIRMASEPDTVVLDARSERLYRLRHLQGAVNLSLPEFTADTLAQVIPTRNTRVLIYCNNNFKGLPESMPVKAVTMPLNFNTHISLHAYGYRNVYELAELVDPQATALTFAGDEVKG